SSESFHPTVEQTGGIAVEEALTLDEFAAPTPVAEHEPSSIIQHEGVLVIADKATSYTLQPDVNEVDVNEANVNQVDHDTTTEMIQQTLPRSASAQPLAEEAAFAQAFSGAHYPAAPSVGAHASRSFTLGPLYASALVLIFALVGAGLWMGLKRGTLSGDSGLVNPTTTETTAIDAGQEPNQPATPSEQSVNGDSGTTPASEQAAGSSTLSTTSAELPASGNAGEATMEVAPAATGDAASANRPSTSAADRTALRGELNKWIAATNARNIDKQMVFYQPTVEAFYNSRNFSRDSVRAHKARVFAQASSIDMRAGAPQITLSDDGRAATMRFRKRYVIKGRNSSSGELVQELRWVKTDAGWKIAGERNVSERLLNEPNANERSSSKARDKNSKSTGSRRRNREPSSRRNRS
nr:nuclear transport factor 2 family protein [Pyrinomonadaceae bacterium]